MPILSLSLSLSLSLLMDRNPEFYFSLAALILGVLGAFYLFLEWLHHRKQYKFLLFWSLGLFLLYWFQVPTILANAGVHFTVSDFNLFFLFAFPLGFLGLILLYLGIRSLLPSARQKKTNRLLLLWFVASLIVFGICFGIGKTVKSHTPTFIITFLFFVPIHLLTLFSIRNWFHQWDGRMAVTAKVGMGIVTLGFLLALAQDFVIVPRILAYPPQFWFVALYSSRLLPFLQSLIILLLLIGFFLVHRNYFRNPDASDSR